jgi:hypothetical protein
MSYTDREIYLHEKTFCDDFVRSAQGLRYLLPGIWCKETEGQGGREGGGIQIHISCKKNSYLETLLYNLTNITFRKL